MATRRLRPALSGGGLTNLIAFYNICLIKDVPSAPSRRAPVPDLGWSPPGRGAQTGWTEGRRAPSATAPPPPGPPGPRDAAGRARPPLAARRAPLPAAAP